MTARTDDMRDVARGDSPLPLPTRLNPPLGTGSDESVRVYADPFREQADAYTRLSEEYTAEVLRLRQQLALAGHRIEAPHDCFLMNCRDLGQEVRDLRERLR